MSEPVQTLTGESIAPGEIEREFDYRPSLWVMVLLAVLVFAGCVLLTYLAVTVQAGVKIRGIQLTLKATQYLFGIAAALSVGSLPIFLWLLYDILFLPARRIALTETGILLPRPSRSGMSREEVYIPFADLLAVQLTTFRGQRWLALVHRQQSIMIVSAMLPTRKAFDAIHVGLLEGLERARRAS